MELQNPNDIKVVVRGGGDLATGVAYRLYRSGFKVIVTELENPLVVRRTVSLAQTIYQDQIEIEDLTGQLADNSEEAIRLIDEGVVPVLIDPTADIIEYWKPTVVVDATMNKKNGAGTELSDAPLVLGLGPGFEAGKDVDAVIETQRGHHLGRVIYKGQALPNTGIPGVVNGVGRKRVIYSPIEGVFNTQRKVGQMIEVGEVIGWINETPIYAKISGCIRGLLKSGVKVNSNVKIGDIDPREDDTFCYTISDKALAMGGGVLEGILTFLSRQK